MKFIYKVRKKYLYENKVQFASPRAKENLLISKDGLHYIETDGFVTSNYTKQKDFNYPNSQKEITDDYYLNLATLNTPRLRLLSTEIFKRRVKHELKNCNNQEKIVYTPHFYNYDIIIDGVYINADNPIIGNKGDIIGIEKSIDSLNFYEDIISLDNKKEVLQFFSRLLSKHDEQYIISKNDGILSARINDNEMSKSNFDINDYISNYIYQHYATAKIEDNNYYDRSLYFININRNNKMEIVNVIFNQSEIKINIINPESLFLSEEKIEFNFLGGPSYMRMGEFDLATFDNDTLEYNYDINKTKKKKFSLF